MAKYEVEDGDDTKKILNRLGSKIKSKMQVTDEDRILIEVDSSDKDELLKELNNNSIDYRVK